MVIIRLVLVTLVACCISSCSTLSKEDNELITLHGLEKLSKSRFDYAYTNPKYYPTKCVSIKLDEINTSLDSQYDQWGNSIWPLVYRQQMLENWNEYFEFSLKQQLLLKNINVDEGEENKCMLVTLNIYDLEFGKKDHSTFITNYRDSTDFDLSILTVKLRGELIDVNTQELHALFIDVKRPDFPKKSIYTYTLETDPKYTMELIDDWAMKVANFIQ